MFIFDHSLQITQPNLTPMLSFRVFASIKSRPTHSHLVGKIPTRSGLPRRFLSLPPHDLCGRRLPRPVGASESTLSPLEGCQTVLSSFHFPNSQLSTFNFQPLSFSTSLSPLSATLMGSPRMCCKQKTYSKAKPFRCNIYAKPRVGGT